MLLAVARTFTPGLGKNASNDVLKAVLRTAVVEPKHDRVVLTATISRAEFASMAQDESSQGISAPALPPAASK